MDTTLNVIATTDETFLGEGGTGNGFVWLDNSTSVQAQSAWLSADSLRFVDTDRTLRVATDLSHPEAGMTVPGRFVLVR